MPENSEDFPRLNYQRLLEIRNHLLWIREVIEVAISVSVICVLIRAHASWIVWIISLAALTGAWWHLGRKYETQLKKEKAALISER